MSLCTSIDRLDESLYEPGRLQCHCGCLAVVIPCYMNTMLHVHIKSPDKHTGLREVSVVCDELDQPMQALLSELAMQLQALPKETTQ